MSEKKEYYFVKEKFEIGKPNRVYVKNEEGRPTGEYDGYYNPGSRTVTLYPAKGSWIYGKLEKQKVAVSLIRLTT